MEFIILHECLGNWCVISIASLRIIWVRPLSMDIMVPWFYILPFVSLSPLFSIAFFFSFLKKILFLFLYLFWLCFLEDSIRATCTTSSLKYLLLNNIPSEGGSVDDNGSHVLLWFSPVNLLVIAACCLFLAPYKGKQ